VRGRPNGQAGCRRGPGRFGQDTSANPLRGGTRAIQKIAVAKSLAVDKRRTSLPSLIEAMFYDLTPGDRSKVKVPKQPERRERELRDLMRKNRHPVVLIVDR
jgi:type II secretory pathway predicted ATPase ExeA